MDIVTHANLLVGANRSALTDRARTLAANAVCAHGGCGNCENCRKAKRNIHPDIITAEREPDKKDLTVDVIRRLITEANVLPTESERKVFIIPDADKMNVQAANAFLKLLEEPPPRVIFFLLGERVKDFLQTIRSRCNVIEVAGLNPEKSAETPPEARAIFAAFANRDAAAMTNEFIKLEKSKREDLETLLNALYMLFAEGAAANPQFAAAAETVAEPAQQLRGGMNLGAGHIVGALMVKLNRLIL